MQVGEKLVLLQVGKELVLLQVREELVLLQEEEEHSSDFAVHPQAPEAGLRYHGAISTYRLRTSSSLTGVGFGDWDWELRRSGVRGDCHVQVQGYENLQGHP
jgi:hypothetical protein